MKHRLAKTAGILIVSALVTSCRGPQADSTRSASGDSSPASGGPLFTPGTPTPESLTRLLGVQVDAAPGEINQYLIRAGQGSVDLTKVGKIHQDLGYAVGVTLPNGTQIGFRYDPPPDPPAEGPAAGAQKN